MRRNLFGRQHEMWALTVALVTAALVGTMIIPASLGHFAAQIDPATSSPGVASAMAGDGGSEPTVLSNTEPFGDQSDLRTRGLWAPEPQPEPQSCCLDAGGPYAGQEGDTITFTATQSGASPPLVYIRWDFDGDGKWERTPTFDLTTAWSTDWNVAWPIMDDLNGDMVTAEAWDGVSPTTEIDTAFIDVRNVAPSVSNVDVTPAPGQEGSAVSVSGTFTDAGVRDDWEYRVNWGDGTASNWTKVDKWEIVGRPRVLFLHTLALGSGYQVMKDALTAACGSDCAALDMWEFGQDPPYAYNRLPTLAEALQYDVIVVASNTCQWYTRGRVLAGNLLANYMDQGRGVVMNAASFYPISGGCGAGIGTLSRFFSQGYTPLGLGDLTRYGPTVYLGQVYEPSHFLMDGVNDVKAYMVHSINDVRPGAVRIADYTSGNVLAATKENPVIPNGARVVALNFFPGPYTKISYGAALDWDRLWGNSVLWAAHAVREKTLPIEVGPLTHVYGDNYLYPAALEVRDDDGGLGDGPISIDVGNVNPEVVGNIEAYAGGTLTLRIAGEKWHDVTATVYLNGVESYFASVVRMPGSPDDQSVTMGNVTFDLRGSETWSARVVYTPMDDPINGQVWGANPVWLVFIAEDGSEGMVHHTFNVGHSDTWVWIVDDLRPVLAGVNLTFRATAMDPGSDDLSFEWDWGDGTPVTARTYYNDGVGPDPYPSPEVNPITVTNEVKHAFASLGTVVVKLKVTDDDGGSTTSVTILLWRTATLLSGSFISIYAVP